MISLLFLKYFAQDCNSSYLAMSGKAVLFSSKQKTKKKKRKKQSKTNQPTYQVCLVLK